MNLVKWAKKGTEQTLWHRNDEWKELLGRYMIEMSNLTTQAVKEVSTSVKKLHWIRLGMVGKEIYQPKTQPETVKLQLFERLERKHLEEGDISLASKLSFLVRGELELQKSAEELDALERQEQLENEGGEDSQTAIGRRNQRSEEEQNDEGSSSTTGAVIENEPSIELDVDPSLFIPPPLHIKLGLVNRAFIKTDTGKSYMSWSQARMENIPIAERIATNLFINADAELTDRKEDKTLWDLRHKQDLDDAKERLSELTSQLRQRNIPNDEKTRLLTDKAVTNEEIAGLNASFKRIVDDLKKARSSRKTLKAAYESEKKKRTYHSKLIHNKKEEAMREIGVDRGAAHGGDLQGRGCTNLLQKADQFFEKCLAIDLEAFDADNNSVLASRDEIVIVNQRFKELAILLERLMYFLMLDHDEVDAYQGEKTLHEDIDRVNEAKLRSPD
jgi:hypothetical protein